MFNSDVNAVVEVLNGCLNELKGSIKDAEHQPSVRLVEFATIGYQFEKLFLHSNVLDLKIFIAIFGL